MHLHAYTNLFSILSVPTLHNLFIAGEICMEMAENYFFNLYFYLDHVLFLNLSLFKI
jgi:hypothetical protein